MAQDREKIRKRIEWVLLVIVFLAHTVILYKIADFNRRIISYPDELVYYDAAKAIYAGVARNIHEAAFGVTNLAYPLVLAPLMGVADTFVRIRLIGLLNAVLLSVTVFPVWMITGELGLKRMYRWATVLVIMIWPDLILSGMLMSEAIYWPLAAFAFLFCIRSFKHRKIYDAALAGAFAYLCYFSREVALCIAIAYGVFQVLSSLIETIAARKENPGLKNRFKAFLKEIDWISLVVFYITFAALYFGVNKLLLSNAFNQYTDALANSSLSASDGTEMYRKLYFLYDFSSYCLAACLGFFILPVLAPMTHYLHMDKLTRKSYLFGMILLGGTLIVTSYIIGMLEDLGIQQMRIHFRYFSPYIMLLLPVYLSSVKEEHYLDDSIREKRFGRVVFVSALFMAVQSLMMQAPLHGAVGEHPALLYFEQLEEKFLALKTPVGASITFDKVSILISLGVCMALGIGFLIARWKKTRKLAIPFFILVISCVCIYNCHAGFGQLRLHYSVSKPVHDDMLAINEYFVREGLEDSNVLYVCDQWYYEDAQAYDLYFDMRRGREYIMNYQTFRNIIGNAEGDRIVLKDTVIPEALRNYPVFAERIDYIIVVRGTDGVGPMLSGLKEVFITTDNGVFRVYQNEDPTNLLLAEDEDRDYLIQTIGFTSGPYYCAPQFVTRGISACEGSFSWTEGPEVEVVVPVSEEVQKVRIKLNTYMTYHGFQEVNVRQDGELIYQGSINGDSEIVFDGTARDGEVRFVIELPTAASPASFGESQDGRQLALALRRIKIYNITNLEP